MSGRVSNGLSVDRRNFSARTKLRGCPLVTACLETLSTFLPFKKTANLKVQVGFPGVSGYQRCLPTHPHFPASSAGSVIRSERSPISVCGTAFQPVHSFHSVNQGVGSSSGVVENQGYPNYGVPGWPASQGAISSEADIECQTANTGPGEV